MRPLGCVKQEAPFYIRKLMMWFPQSWQLKYERQWAAQGGLPSPVLNDVHPHSNWGRPRQRVSGRICPSLNPPPTHFVLLSPATCPTWPWHTIIKLWMWEMTLQSCNASAIVFVAALGWWCSSLRSTCSRSLGDWGSAVIFKSTGCRFDPSPRSQMLCILGQNT